MITAVAAILGAVAALVYAACRLAGECDDRMERRIAAMRAKEDEAKRYWTGRRGL